MLGIIYLRDVIRISLQPLGWWSQEAEELLLMTAAHESRCGKYLRQLDGGPALGIYQMEPETLYDNYLNYLNYSNRKKIAEKIKDITGVDGPQIQHLQFNPIYSTIHARLKYRRNSDPIPKASDAWALAEYAKDVYNTYLGEASVEKYYEAYRDLILK